DLGLQGEGMRGIRRYGVAVIDSNAMTGALRGSDYQSGYGGICRGRDVESRGGEAGLAVRQDIADFLPCVCTLCLQRSRLRQAGKELVDDVVRQHNEGVQWAVGRDRVSLR